MHFDYLCYLFFSALNLAYNTYTSNQIIHVFRHEFIGTLLMGLRHIQLQRNVHEMLNFSLDRIWLHKQIVIQVSFTRETTGTQRTKVTLGE